MPAAIPVVAGEAAIAMGAQAAAEMAALEAARLAAMEAAKIAAAEAAAQAATTAAANTATSTAANLATNQSILGAIGAGGGTPASAALTGAGSGLGGAGSGLGAASSAYTGALTGSPAAYGMPPAGIEQIANPALTAPPAYGMPPGTAEGLLQGNASGFNQLSQAELANFENAARGAQDLATNAKDLGQVASNNLTPDMLNQSTAMNAVDGAYQSASAAPASTSAAPNALSGTYQAAPPVPSTGPNFMNQQLISNAGGAAPPPSTLENAFTKAMDWVKDNKMTTLSMGMNAAKLFGKDKGDGSDNNKYSGVLSKYKLSPDFQGRQADPADYQYTPKVYTNAAQGGIMQAYAGGGPVEMMSNANAIGANTGYPMADINKGAYATPYQQPISRNVIGGVSDTGVNPMTGEMRFAEGGITGQGNLDLNIPLNIGGGGGGGGFGGGGRGDGSGAGYSGGYEPSNGGFGSGMMAPAVQRTGQFAGGNNQGLGGLANGIMGLFGNLNGRAQSGGTAPMQDAMYRPAIGMPGGQGGKTTYSQPGGFGGEYLTTGMPSLHSLQLTPEQMAERAALGEMHTTYGRFKEGGSVASYKDGGKAAMDYYERMTKPKEGFSGKSDPGARYAGEVMFDTDPDTRSLDPVTAAIIRQAKVNKRANMQLPGIKRPTPMGQINMVPANMKKGDESPNTVDAAGGGIMSLGGYAAGGNPRLLKGPGDGMSDNIPATISGKQPARLADGEFVVPADVVSHLGNGSTEAGAKKLHQMMTNVRKARTGNPKQGKQINPNKYMPK